MTTRKSNAPDTSPGQMGFTPEVLDKTVIAIPLLHLIRQAPGAAEDVIIDLNLEYTSGRRDAALRVANLIDEACSGRPKTAKNARGAKKTLGRNESKGSISEQYVFATLTGRQIEKLVKLDTASNHAARPRHERAIYRIWPDFPIKRMTVKSVSTVKADAARNSFAAYGEGIVWAVCDSGIDGTHPHFMEFGNLKLEEPLRHRDFTVTNDRKLDRAQLLSDPFGHGTHVAGIIAGTMTNAPGRIIQAKARYRNELGDVKAEDVKIERITGMAPKCKLLSLKVLDENGDGQASNLIAAIAEIQEINGYGRRLRVHGVNLSVGYDFNPEWFACGQSPLCVEVDRLVKSGVVVVAAAGNSGFGYAQTAENKMVAAGMDLTINDPGNAELAITVGSTHREMPHVYGVSYFSSKGPTGDGRMKPDLVAPGEKIISCRSSAIATGPGDNAAVNGNGQAPVVAAYKEESGTSMAAPHVSGVIAAFLSARREFIGQPERVKDIFLSTATDLKRAPYFQGRGLVDLMRAIQSV
ncbi:serine metalloprotease MrpA [Caballeronia pedi]|uniref:Serine metalloprotease MrpA n=1 Tax=Caballeronia pedi TaxID=1777141 RepID=A0A158E6W9_9BURK|nr:S8 family peptidase [Caballeronia pedi]SAL02156.1 serine metalloprotease MrpA [Caballeronia pedi]